MDFLFVNDGFGYIGEILLDFSGIFIRMSDTIWPTTAELESRKYSSPKIGSYPIIDIDQDEFIYACHYDDPNQGSGTIFYIDLVGDTLEYIRQMAIAKDFLNGSQDVLYRYNRKRDGGLNIFIEYQTNDPI